MDNISCNFKVSNNTIDPENNFLFNLFGIKIYFDDLLLACVLLFLYEEKIEDQLLFIVLILLLLS